jgi:hypothetical protein
LDHCPSECVPQFGNRPEELPDGGPAVVAEEADDIFKDHRGRGKRHGVDEFDDVGAQPPGVCGALLFADGGDRAAWKTASQDVDGVQQLRFCVS